MKKVFSTIVFTLLGFLACTNAWAQLKLTNTDFSFQYSIKSDLRGKIISSKKDSSALLYIRFNAPLDSMKKFAVGYSLINSLDEEIITKVELNNLSSYFQYEDKTGSQYGIKVNIKDYKYFILWLSDTTKNIKYPYVQLLSRNFQSEDIILKQERINSPIFSSYLPLNSVIRAVSMSEFITTIKVDYYDYHFLPAKPPMSLGADSLTTPFTIDESFNLKSNDSVRFSNKGLYYFHLGESKLGKSVIIKDSQYPKVNQVDLLVESLRYLATEEEYMKMEGSFKKKELFDQFWLNNTKSEAKAKRAIKEYYKRVRDANTLFTNYKEGWKTDMGMIYIVFGPPSKVFIRNDGIMWIYTKTFELPRVAFFFNHVDTAFTDQHYVLERKLEFQNLWFRTVDLWRSGRKEF